MSGIISVGTDFWKETFLLSFLKIFCGALTTTSEVSHNSITEEGRHPAAVSPAEPLTPNLPGHINYMKEEEGVVYVRVNCPFQML